MYEVEALDLVRLQTVRALHSRQHCHNLLRESTVRVCVGVWVCGRGGGGRGGRGEGVCGGGGEGLKAERREEGANHDGNPS